VLFIHKKKRVPAPYLLEKVSNSYN